MAAKRVLEKQFKVSEFFGSTKKLHISADKTDSKDTEKEHFNGSDCEENSPKLLFNQYKIGSSWYNALKPEFSCDKFNKMIEFVKSQRTNKIIYPPDDKIFTWTLMCSISKIRVVIIGQDPYHGRNQANGLCFSVPSNIGLPPSLVNIYKELASDIPGFKAPTHGCLSGWAKQGVLLLNACLTVEANKPNSHQNMGWEWFTDSVISWLSSHLEHVVFILWGRYAQKKGEIIKNRTNHQIISSAHPSPFSANNGFFGSKPFSKTNLYLVSKGLKEINWSDLPQE